MGGAGVRENHNKTHTAEKGSSKQDSYNMAGDAELKGRKATLASEQKLFIHL